MYSSLHKLRKFVCYFYAKYVISIQAYTYCVNLCATFMKMCDKYSSLNILRKFVCYFYAKYVTSIQAYTDCVNLCATFTQNVWLTLFCPESVHFKEFALFLLQIGLCCDLRVPCVKLLVLKLRSRKFFDKFHVRRCGRIIKTKQIKQNQQLNK